MDIAFTVFKKAIEPEKEKQKNMGIGNFIQARNAISFVVNAEKNIIAKNKKCRITVQIAAQK